MKRNETARKTTPLSIGIVIQEGKPDYAVCKSLISAHFLAYKKAKENPGEHFIVLQPSTGYIKDKT